MKRFLFYFLNLTWGLPLNIVGGLVALVLVIARKKPKRWGDCFYFEVGENWGGLELGIFFLTSKNPSIHTRNHEHGHAIQNCFFGVLMPFIVNIPSAIRYWLRKFKTQKGKYIYSTIIAFCIGIIGSSLIFIPLTIFEIVGRLLIVYAVIICGWLLEKEIPQYKSNKYVDYDAVWYEYTATKLGTKYVGELNYGR